MRNLTTIIAALAVSACAQHPDAIPPVSMGNAFDSMSCRDARIALSDEYNTLRALSGQQQQAVVGDAIGVFLIGVPVSSLSGSDKAGLIAASKGKALALENRVARC